MGYIYECPLYKYDDYINNDFRNPVAYLPIVLANKTVDVKYYDNTTLFPYIWKPNIDNLNEFISASNGFPVKEYPMADKLITTLIKQLKTYQNFSIDGIESVGLFTKGHVRVYYCEGVMWGFSSKTDPQNLSWNGEGIVYQARSNPINNKYYWLFPIESSDLKYDPYIKQVREQYGLTNRESIYAWCADTNIDVSEKTRFFEAVNRKFLSSTSGNYNSSFFMNTNIYYRGLNPNQLASIIKTETAIPQRYVVVQQVRLPAILESDVKYLEGANYNNKTFKAISVTTVSCITGTTQLGIIGAIYSIYNRRPYVTKLAVYGNTTHKFSDLFGGTSVTEPAIGKYFEDGYPNGGNDDSVQQKDGSSGQGDYDNTNDPIEFPAVPLKTASLSGMVSLWNPEINEISQLNSYLWSPEVVDILKKFWNDPMDGIISLSLVPIDVGATEYREVRIGGNYTGIRMKRIFNQIQKVNMGKLKFAEYFGSFADYSPYTTVYLYLPYIGMTQLNVDDIMDCDLELEYMIDLFDGTTVANLRSVRVWDGLAGIVGSWAGNCQTQIPVSSVSYREMLAGAARAGIGMLTGSMVAGAALGAQPQPQWKNNPFYVHETGELMSYRTLEGDNTNVLNERAMGGSLQMQGVQGMNMGLNAKGQVSRGGNANCTAGALSVQTPYLIINRPVSAMPDGINDFIGYPSYSRGRLRDQQGFTQVLYVKLENLTATQKERAELDQILKGGVIF